LWVLGVPRVPEWHDFGTARYDLSAGNREFMKC
jgi:hypothetical protein